MGLDMFLRRKVKKGFGFTDEPKVEIGTWRKVNHIHNWFVQNVQNGNDNQDNYEVTFDQAQKLRDTCAKAMKEFNKNGKLIGSVETLQSLLPTLEGFYFGPTDYGEFYYQGLVKTVAILDDALSGRTISWDTETLYYGCWW